MKYHIEVYTQFRIVDDETLSVTHAASSLDLLHNLKGVELFLEKLGYTKGYIADTIENIENVVKWLEEEES